MKRVLFRCDASGNIGSGHLMRCRSLARALQELDFDIRFCVRLPSGNIYSSFTREFLLYLLPGDGDKPVDPEHGNWLPVSEVQDALLTYLAVQGSDSWVPNLIVVDHYGLSAAWHHEIRRLWPSASVAVIDDLADRPLDPDLLINHNVSHQDWLDLYRPLLPQNRDIGFCFGPEYALIDPFYSLFHGCLPPRREAKRLLIALGGGGDLGLLEKILQVLLDCSHLEFEIQLVQGGFAKDSSLVNKLCSELGVETLHSLPSLAPLMAAADFAIGAGGTSTWERLSLGLPSITYALAVNQQAYSEVLSDLNLIQYMGSADVFDASSLQQALEVFVNDSNRFNQVSSASFDLVDGKGCLRLARLMSSIVETEQWKTVNSRYSDSMVSYFWPDELSISAAARGLPGPLRCIDILHINRNQPHQQASHLSIPGISPIQSDIKRVSVVSSPGSWMNRYIPDLISQALRLGFALNWVHDHTCLSEGDVCFILSYGRLLSEEWLDVHRHNLVVHASALPQGKGWSPMTWQILEGSTLIPLTLFEAAVDLDAGPIYSQKFLKLDGHELAPEWQKLQALEVIKLCLNWLSNYPDSKNCSLQSGEESFYNRRRPEDSCLDSNLTLQELFPLLRVVDNTHYPAYFRMGGHRFRLLIEPWPTPDSSDCTDS